MGRAGRKTKSRRRHPCGKLVADKKQPDDRIKVARQPHRRTLKPELRMDERAESALGRMLLRGQITRSSYDAGVRFAVLTGQYRATIEAPRATAGSGRGFFCAAEACIIDPRSCGCLWRRENYARAYRALAEAGYIAMREVVRVAIQGEEPNDIPALVSGLGRLKWHFGWNFR